MSEITARQIRAMRDETLWRSVTALEQTTERPVNPSCRGVYLIRRLGHPDYKIGICQDLRRRIAAIRTGFPYPLQVVAFRYSENARRIEQALHGLLQNNRIAREWFELTEAEARDVRAVIENDEDAARAMRAWHEGE